MNENRYGILAVLLFALFVAYLWLNPQGIKLGYKLYGGEAVSEAEINETETIVREYEEQVDTYNRYKDSDNPTTKSWAETAKAKANELAVKYNSLVNDNFLEMIGE